MGSNKSFSARLSLNILLMVSLIFIVALIFVAISSSRIIIDESTKSAQLTLDVVSAEIEKDITEVEISTSAGAQIMTAYMNNDMVCDFMVQSFVNKSDLLAASMIAFVEGVHRGDTWYSTYAYRDSLGAIKMKKLGSEDYDYRYMEWFQIPYMLKQPYWSEPYYDEGGCNQYIATFACPIMDKDSNVLAVMTADVPLSHIASRVNSIHPYEHSYMNLVSYNGLYINANDSNGLGGQTLMAMAYESQNEAIIESCQRIVNGESGISKVLQGSVAALSVFKPLHNGWKLSLVCEYRDIMARTTQMHIMLALVCLFGLLIMFIICYSIVRRLTRPITELSEATISIAKGNFATILPEIRTEDEMLRLRDSFAFMQTSLGHYISELKSTTAANERMEGELNVARNIQMGMLATNFPPQLSAFLQPAKEVGGDLYDFLIKDNTLYFAVGDVSGKGVPAALMMAITRSAFRFFSGLGFTMGQVMGRINKAVAEANETGMFVTCISGRIDLETGVMKFCNAGHNPIIVMPPSGEPYFLKAKPNLAIGLFDSFVYEDEELTLEPGTRLLIYTDGISEAETRAKELFGDDRLLAWAKEKGAVVPRQLDPDGSNKVERQVVDSLLETVRKFVESNEPNDDITIMSILFGQK